MMVTKFNINMVIKKLLCNKCFLSFVAFVLVFLNYKYCFAAADAEYLEFCVNEHFTQKYENAECWSCDVVTSLMAGMTSAASILGGTVLALSKELLLYFGAIWIAVYFLKSLGSFAKQDPSKMLDGLFVFMFKWSIAYAMIYFGMECIADYIVNPLIGLGVDIGTGITNAGGLN